MSARLPLFTFFNVIIDANQSQYLDERPSPVICPI